MADTTDEHFKSNSLLTIPDTAGRLKVCRASVYTLIRRGDLAVVKIRGATRIRPADVDDLIERNVRRRTA